MGAPIRKVRRSACARRAALTAAVAVPLIGMTSSSTYGVVRYWDTNDAAAGPGANPINGTWSTAAANWSTSSTGGAATAVWPASGPAGLDTATFSAGTTGSTAFTVTVDTVTVQVIALQEGTPTVSGGTITFASGATQRSTAPGATATAATINSQISGSSGLR